MKIFVAPTQHWDPFWTIKTEVSERMGVNNLRKALDIIKEKPEFRYALDQVYLLGLFKKHFPERIEELKTRIKEGRIELVCGGYVNPDLNLPSGESIIRQITFGKRVWQEEFGVNPKATGIMDNFGQSGQLPQIFLKSGLKYHTSKRGPSKDLPACFIWEGVDGSQILFDRQPLGHHGIVQFPYFSFIPKREKPWEKLEKICRPFSFFLAAIALCLPDFHIWVSTKGRVATFRQAIRHLIKLYPSDKVFIPHGFGADGARPFGWIVYLCKFYSRFSKKKMFISTPSQFFESLEQDKDKLIVVKGELNGPTEKKGEAFGSLPGAYSTRVEVKKMARENEKLLYLAELLESLKFLASGKPNQYKNTIPLWKLKFLTDFHDSICGCQTDANFEIIMQGAFLLKKECEKIIKDNLRLPSRETCIFNPLPWERKEMVQLGGERKLIRAIPMAIGPAEILAPENKFEFLPEQKTLVTPFYKVSWGDGLEIYHNGRKITGEKFARFRLQQEKGDAYFFDVSGEEWCDTDSINLVESGPIRATLEIKSHFSKIKISQLIHFYLHIKRVDFAVKLDNQAKDIRLQAHLPFNIGAEETEVTREIPAGFIKEGESPGQAKWRDVFGERYGYYDQIKCVQNWIYFGLEEGLAIFNKGLPEHEIINSGGCFLTLLRCVGRLGTTGKWLKKFSPSNVPWRAGSPFAIPLAQEQGEHEFSYAFFPAKRQDIVRECYEFLFPLEFCQGRDYGSSPLFSTSDKNVIPLAVKKAERGNGIVIRLLETEGKEKAIEIELNPTFKSGTITNLMEEKIADLAIENNTIKLRIKPQEIVTLILEK